VLPPDGIIKAARRWLDLLQRSDFKTARALVRARSDQHDLTYTQYAAALEWLATAGLLREDMGDFSLVPKCRSRTLADLDLLLFTHSIEAAGPPWLTDADILIPDHGAIPDDAARLAEILELDDRATFQAIQQLHGRIDLAARSEVGLNGELMLATLLESEWPGSVQHLALHDDGIGYDIAFTVDQSRWNLEVKSTTKRGRSIFYLSRHEFEVAQSDPMWRLVYLRLANREELAEIASADAIALRAHAPRDIGRSGRWESARFELPPNQLQPGLAALGLPPGSTSNSAFLSGRIEVARNARMIGRG
jgi:hypothetical protein